MVPELVHTYGGVQRLKVERAYDRLNWLEFYRAIPNPAEPWGRTNLYNLASQLEKSQALDGSYWDYTYNERGEVTRKQ